MKAGLARCTGELASLINCLFRKHALSLVIEVYGDPAANNA
jgi:hypothetical protein